MDERKLAELFRESVPAAPVAHFDARDVAQASRRITARRRMAAAGGTLVAAVVVAGGIGMGTGMFTPDRHDVAGAPPVPSVTGIAPETPTVLSPRSVSGCGPDQQLAVSVTAVIPDTSTAVQGPAQGCPSGSRAVTFTLSQGGSVTAIVSPVGTVAPDQLATGERRLVDGSAQSVRRAHSGKVVVVLSRPAAGGQAPYADRLPGLADALATQF